jgi:RNA polymerase I-specific transcription initiation factor RRN7
MKGFLLIPFEMRKRLPQYYLSMLTPRVAPTADKLHEAVQQLVVLFKEKFNVIFPTPMWEPLLFKIVHDLLLPPEMYIAAQTLLTGLKLDWLELPSEKKIFKRNIPEIQLMCAVVLCTKLCFGLDKTARMSNVQGDCSSMILDWDLWSDMLRKLWIEDESFSEADEREVLYWDKSKIDRYLSWFQDSFIADPTDSNASISRKRMLDQFPLEPLNRSTDMSPQPQTVAEILRVVQSTTKRVQNEDDHDDDQDLKEVVEPGARYESYRNSHVMPSMILTLYDTAARLCAVRIETIRAVVYRMELQCKKRKLYS